MKRTILFLTIALSAVACGRLNQNAPRSTTNNFSQTMHVGGRERSYAVHLPPNITTAPSHALVIVLHGGAGNTSNAAEMTGMSTKADQENFVAVYPGGSGRLGDVLLTWNSGNCCGYALDQKINDVGFIRALIDKMLAAYPIDAKRVFVTGISNGAMMAYRLGCELSDTIAAIAPVAGALNVDCKPNQPVSVIAFHGTADQHVSYEGGTPNQQIDFHPREDNSVAYSMSFWTQHDGCNATSKRDERGNVVHEAHPNCANGTAVELYTIQGGGHAWPGSKSYLSGDTPTREISATDVMWEFFKRHPKQKMKTGGVNATLVSVKNAGHGFTAAGGAISPSRAEISKMIADFFDKWLR